MKNITFDHSLNGGFGLELLNVSRVVTNKKVNKNF